MAERNERSQTNETNQIDQTNEMDQTNRLRPHPLRLTRFTFHAPCPRYPLFAFPAKQQCLYFLPLPQGQGALPSIPWPRRGTKGSSDSVSW
jgi:hypothetical protein